MMEKNVVNRLQDIEASEILAFKYFDLSSKALGLNKKEFLLKLNKYLYTGMSDSESENKFFDFLIEISSLTFTLYKWGALIVNLKAAIFGDIILTIYFNNNFTYIYEQNGEFCLKNCQNKDLIFKPELTQKSYIVAILAFLYSQESNVELKMVELDSYDKNYSGNYVSFNQEKALNEVEFINYIDGEFPKYQTRLKELQTIFYDNFIEG